MNSIPAAFVPLASRGRRIYIYIYIYVCRLCVAAGSDSKHSFESLKALDSHSRAKHGNRNPVRMYNLVIRTNALRARSCSRIV